MMPLEVDTRPKRHRWAPGAYMCTCDLCGKTFQGDKRAIHCAPCAYARPDQPPAAPLFRFVPGPLTFHEEHPHVNGGPAIVDAKGSVVAVLFWPCHAPEDTAAAEQELYAVGRLMTAAANEKGDRS